MKVVHAIAFILVIVGGINWGLVGINANWNVVDALLGAGSMISSIVYILVGVSAIYLVATHKQCCKTCESTASAPLA